MHRPSTHIQEKKLATTFKHSTCTKQNIEEHKFVSLFFIVNELDQNVHTK